MSFQLHTNYVDSDLFAYLWFTGMSFQLHANNYAVKFSIHKGLQRRYFNHVLTNKVINFSAF